MKIELTHDIIALKVWEQLPEQDKILRSIQQSVIRRQQDFVYRNGGLLSEQEYDEWKGYFKKGNWNQEVLIYIKKSYKEIQQQKEAEAKRLLREQQLLKRKNKIQRLFIGVLSGLLLTIIAFGITYYLQSKQNHKIAFENIIGNAKQLKVQAKYSEAITTLNTDKFNYSSKELEIVEQYKTRFKKLLQLQQQYYRYPEDSLYQKLQLAKQMEDFSPDEYLKNLVVERQKNLDEKFDALLTDSEEKISKGSSVDIRYALKRYNEALLLKPENQAVLDSIEMLKKKVSNY